MLKKLSKLAKILKENLVIVSMLFINIPLSYNPGKGEKGIRAAKDFSTQNTCKKAQFGLDEQKFIHLSFFVDRLHNSVSDQTLHDEEENLAMPENLAKQNSIEISLVNSKIYEEPSGKAPIESSSTLTIESKTPTIRQT